MSIPDFDQLEKLRGIFDAFKTKQDLLQLLDKSMRASGVSIFIGEESGYSALTECSIVTAPYQADGRCIGVLGGGYHRPGSRQRSQSDALNEFGSLLVAARVEIPAINPISIPFSVYCRYGALSRGEFASL